MEELGTLYKPNPIPKDTRECLFCNTCGDGDTNGPGRFGKPFGLIFFINKQSTSFVYLGHRFMRAKYF